MQIDSLPNSDMVRKVVGEILKENGISKELIEEYESKIVNSKEEVIRLSNLGFSYLPIGNSECPVQRKILG